MRTQKITFLMISLLFSWLSMSAQYELTVTNEVSNLPGLQGKLHVTANGVTGPYEVTWHNGQQIVLDAGNTVTLANLGTGTYTVSITNTYGCEKLLTATIRDNNLEQKVGNVANNISIYPNPNTGEFFIDLGEDFTTEPQKLTVQDISGKTIRLIDLPGEIKSPIPFNLSDLVNGIYVVSLQSGDNLFSERIVISK